MTIASDNLLGPTIGSGETIPYGDPRLCKHIGRQP